MTDRIGGVEVSDRAKRLVEALHELHGNEARWMVVQAFLDEEREEAARLAASYDCGPECVSQQKCCNFEERIAARIRAQEV